MLWDLINLLRAWWDKSKNTSIVLQKSLFFTILMMAIAFVGGRLRPDTDYSRLQLENDKLRNSVRELAIAREKNESAIRRAQLAADLNDKAAVRLRQRISELTAENIQRSEEAIFYRRALGTESQPSLNIYALEQTPDFRPGTHRLSAVLIFPQTEFLGSYYFEIITKDNPTVVRVPTEGNMELELESYAEIEQAVVLPDGTEVAKLRLVVENAEGEIETELSIDTASINLDAETGRSFDN